VQAEGSGIRSVRATPENADTLVRVFAQPTSYLTAHRIGDKVVIQETNDIKTISDDLRAQIDPKEAAKSDTPSTDGGSSTAGSATSSPEVEKKSSDVSSEAARKASKVKAGSADDELTEADFSALLDDSSRYTGRLISLDLQDTDIDNALRIIAEVSNLNIVASDEVTGKVTLRLTDVPWDQALDVILKTNGLDKVLEGNVMRIAPVDKLRSERESFKQARQAEEELEPLSVKYLRVSYAKAAELKALVETVVSERGTVAYDERSNQLIVKDVRKGLKNVIELVKKVDLRTPQVLLETQIVEAKRNLTRELGSELGFQYIQSPSTGNGTGLNFPSAVAIGGSAGPGPVTASSFPAVAGASAVSMLFDSADGTKSLELRLSQLEQEGRVRIISKPAVATTNNKPAEIKSVEKIRIRLPNGGLSVATGSGASASGSGSIAAETIEAGITLNVTPQASPDYFVLLDIKANSSSFSSDRDVEGIPNEIARSASSTVLVSSGQTFALGGIYKIIDNDDLQGVPFFKDIPVLGTFFRRSVTRDSDEELLFFITPRIVEGSFDDASMKAAL
jgi:type IV pilus assembly protein PilQ